MKSDQHQAQVQDDKVRGNKELNRTKGRKIEPSDAGDKRDKKDEKDSPEGKSFNQMLLIIPNTEIFTKINRNLNCNYFSISEILLRCFS